MTTNIKINTTNNVFTENNVYNLQKIEGYSNLSGISLLKKVESSRDETCLLVAEYIFLKTVENLCDFNIWIFSAFCAPNNRVLLYKYRKDFCKEAYQIEILPSKKKDFLRVVENNTSMKYYHIINIFDDKQTRDVLIKNLFCDRMSYSKYIVMLPKNTDMKNALKVDWCSPERFDKNLLKFVVHNSGIIFREVGWFDDVDAGFVGIGDNVTLSKFCPVQTPVFTDRKINS